MADYLSYPIYEPAADTVYDLSAGPACELVVRGEVWNNQSGAVYSPKKQDYVWSWSRIFRTRAQRMTVLNWWKSLYGSANPFWLRFPAPAFYTSGTALSGAASIYLLDGVSSYEGLIGVVRHVWIGAAGHARAYRIDNPVVQIDGTLLVRIVPNLAANLAGGTALDPFLFCRYSSDEMEFPSSRLSPSCIECSESFVERQRDTPA